MKTIEKIIWDQAFSVGVEIIDEQHKNLIKMINTIIDVSGTEDSGEIMSAVLSQMQQYATEHFRLEEKCMINCGYEGYDQHKAEHVKYKRRVAMLCVETMQQRKVVETEILEFLTSWWTKHILQSDMKYRTCFQKNDPSDLNP